MNNNIYIIGDVHGCYETLKALIDKLPNKENSKICFVGDLIDRGKDSSKVIKLIREHNYDCVLGNHEHFMVESLPKILQNKEYIKTERWTVKAGGIPTIQSYKNTQEILDDLEYLKTLPLYIEYKNYKTVDGRYLVVSHSSVESKWQYRNYSKDSKEYEDFRVTTLSARYKSFDNKEIFNVYGHTPTENVIVNSFRAQIDLGCCYKDINPNATLCALEFPSMRVFTQENIENC